MDGERKGLIKKKIAEKLFSIGWLFAFLLLTRTVYIHHLYRVEWLNCAYATLSKGVTVGVILLFFYTLFTGGKLRGGVLCFVLLLFAWQTASTLLLGGSLRRTVRIYYPMLGMGCFLSLLCASETRTRKFIGVTADFLLFLSAVNFLLMLTDPARYAMEDSFMNAYLLGSENQISLTLLVSVLFCLLDVAQGGAPAKGWICLGLYFASALWIRSASGLVAAFVVGALTLFPFAKKLPAKYSLIAFALATAAVGFVVVLAGVWGIYRFPPFSFLLERVLGKDASLTGRTEIWRQALAAAVDSPLFGYGVEESGNPFYISVYVQGVGLVQGRLSAHNQFLQAAYEGGIPALLIPLAAVGKASCALKGSGVKTEGAVKIVLVGILVVLTAESASFDGVFLVLQLAALIQSKEEFIRKALINRLL